jgi:hypothetical protein
LGLVSSNFENEMGVEVEVGVAGEAQAKRKTENIKQSVKLEA